MSDVTAQVTALQRARIDMQTEMASNKISIREKYAERMKQEIEDANLASKIRFARLLKEAHDAGLPQSVIRSEVLRTNVWSRWVEWRDLAEIAPDRVIVSTAREVKKLSERLYRWEPYSGSDTNALGHALVLMKTPLGDPFAPMPGVVNGEVFITRITEKDGELEAWPSIGGETHRAVWETYWETGTEMKDYVSRLANAHRNDIAEKE